MSDSELRLPPEAWRGAELRGRQILVAGAAGGVGRAASLAAAAAGANVVLLGRRVAALEKLYDEIEAAGHPQPAIYPLNLEAATPADYDDLCERLIEGCGRLDGMVYAASRLHGLTPIEHFEPEEWLRTLQVDLHAPFLLLRALLPAWRRSQAPAALFLFDDPSRSGAAYWGAYGVAQAGLRALLTGVAAETRQEGLRVLGLQPAAMATALRRQAYIGESPQALVDPRHYGPALAWMLAAAPAEWSGRIVVATDRPAGHEL